jgi:hypothetical protein
MRARDFLTSAITGRGNLRGQFGCMMKIVFVRARSVEARRKAAAVHDRLDERAIESVFQD